MSAEQDVPHIGELLRHYSSGLAVRVENRISALHVFTVRFSDGVTELAHLQDLHRDLSDEEKRRYAQELPIVTARELQRWEQRKQD